MQTVKHKYTGFLFCIALFHLCPPLVAAAGDVRKPVFAGSFYPATRQSLVAELDRLEAKAAQTRPEVPEGRVLKALIMPHAGYMFSGWTAAHATDLLKTGTAERIVLMGPDHRVGLQNAAVSDVRFYETPLGVIPLNRDAETLRASSELFRPDPASDRSEHSLEVVLPFLQHFHRPFELIPIVVGRGNIDAMTDALKPLIDARTLIVVSSDLSHFLPYGAAVKKDRQTIDLIVGLNEDALLANPRRACGVQPAAMLIRLAREFGWTPVELHYANSGDTAGDRSRVVGYTTIAFFGDAPMTTPSPPPRSRGFTDEQGQILVRLARQTIMRRLDLDSDRADVKQVETALGDKAFEARRGTFVTLNMDRRLRGCIGSLAARESVAEGVRGNALNAAFNDHRFPPLTAGELDRVTIDVSILTDPKPLAYKDGQDLLAKLKPGVDGLIIRKGPRSATFLPQVWEQLPAAEDFLGHLCAKAGLPRDAWKGGGLEVHTYQVQYFEEQR